MRDMCESSRTGCHYLVYVNKSIRQATVCDAYPAVMGRMTVEDAVVVGEKTTTVALSAQQMEARIYEGIGIEARLEQRT
jgi:hypothetical protein